MKYSELSGEKIHPTSYYPVLTVKTPPVEKLPAFDSFPLTPFPIILTPSKKLPIILTPGKKLPKILTHGKNYDINSCKNTVDKHTGETWGK